MSDNLIRIDSKLGSKIWEFFKHPITGLLVGVLLSVLFYFLAISNKEPSYYITPPTLVAERSDNDLKIIYKGQEYSSLYYRDLVLWNEGDQYIDSENFIDSKPISLAIQGHGRILSVSTIKSSRKDLLFSSQIINGKLATFRIMNEEAMEQGDGVCFHILYSETGGDPSKFILQARVKGVKNGFVYRDVSKQKRQGDKHIYVLWGMLLTMLLIRVVVLLVFKRDVVFRQWEAKFLSVLFLISVYLTVEYIYYSVNLNWW